MVFQERPMGGMDHRRVEAAAGSPAFNWDRLQPGLGQWSQGSVHELHQPGTARRRTPFSRDQWEQPKERPDAFPIAFALACLNPNSSFSSLPRGVSMLRDRRHLPLLKTSCCGTRDTNSEYLTRASPSRG